MTSLKDRATMMSLVRQPYSRRTALKGICALAVSAATRAHGAESPERITGMGVVLYDFNLRRKMLRKQDPTHDLFQPLAFLKHCHRIGAGGIQANLGNMDPGAVRALRDFSPRCRPVDRRRASVGQRPSGPAQSLVRLVAAGQLFGTPGLVHP